MDSPLPIVRPWTPPDTDLEPSPRSDYFSDPFRPPSSYSPDDEKRWAHLPSHSNASAQLEPRCDTPTEAQNHARPKPVERVTDPAPYTPTKNLNYGGADANGALRYPYTPDSSRILRRSTELPSSPPQWDEYSEHSSSPVQNALSSCLAHFENLIQSQQPDEDQMEYIVAQFEAMTSFLSAPDAQTRKTDDHLFSEPDLPTTTGLGISTADEARAAKLDHMSQEAHDAYVAEVGAYIAGVKGYIEDLKMRLDEVKMLNSIQLDVINDLRRQMKSVRRNMRSSLDMREDVKMVEEELERIAHEDEGRIEQFGLDSWETLVDEERGGQASLIPKDQNEEEEDAKIPDFVPGRHRIIHIVRQPERRSFWSSFGEALDSFGELILDY